MANKNNQRSRKKLSRLARARMRRANFQGIKTKQKTQVEVRKDDPTLSTPASHASVIEPVEDSAHRSIESMLEFCDVEYEVIDDSDVCEKSSEQGVSDVNISNNRISSPLMLIETIQSLNKAQHSQRQSAIRNGWSEFLKDDEQLRLATGIESFELLQAIIERMRLATNCQYETDKAVMNTENRVVMTYLKLKQNLSYDFLALMFNSISEKQCEEIFRESVVTLGKCLRSSAISWPSKLTVMSNLPQCFKSLKSVRVMINCIQTSMYTRSKFSQLHDATSFRTMIGVTPSGMISFIDRSCGGNLSNSAVFKQSKLLRLVEAGDVVLVHKDFSLAGLNEKYNFHIIECGESRNLSQRNLPVAFQDEEAMKIVERVLAHIKEFDILDTFPLDLLTCIDHILAIICATFNLSTPIINDDEFI